jgi:soluble lytic murein transglycosylase
MKQYDKALKPLGQLAIDSPLHPHGVWAEGVFSEVLSSARIPLSRKPELGRSPAQRLLRTQNLVGGGALQEALFELERLPDKLGPAAKAEAAFWRTRIYFAQGKTEAALQQLALALKGNPKTAQQASWLVARRHMRSQENDAAREWLAKAAAGGGKPAEEARFMSAWLWLNESKWKEAENALGTFAGEYPNSSFAVDARWFQGWAQFRQNNCSKASQTWLSAANQYPKSVLLPQFHYWALRCAPQNNEAEKQALQQAFQNLAARFPGSLYGRMAKERMQSDQALFSHVSSSSPSSPSSSSGKPPPLPPELGLAQALAQAGLLADAQTEFEELRKRTRGSEDAQRIGAALQSLGAYDVAYVLAARNLWGAAFSRKESAALSLLFPKAFEAEVLAASKTHQLPPALIWAVMRRESAFSTSALSHANARGLMQIIPPTGQHIAKQLHMTLSNPDELFAPALNISFGSWYLKKLVERFGHLAPAIASYNAGPKAVVRWLDARGKLPLDEWIEEIPFRETRNYVKQVLPDVYAFMEMYAELSSSPPPAWTWTLPEPQKEGVDF